MRITFVLALVSVGFTASGVKLDEVGGDYHPASPEQLA